MPNTIQVTGDDDPFYTEQEMINKSIASAREALDRVSLTTICIDCGEPIGAERKKAVPSAMRCIECETANARR